MKKLFGLLTLMLLVMSVNAQEKELPKKRTIQFKTSAICGMCKERIEDKLNYTGGVIFAEQNLDTKVLTVKYKTKKITAEDIYKLVSKTGYKAGDMERDTTAFKKLPKCCQEKGFCND